MPADIPGRILTADLIHQHTDHTVATRSIELIEQTCLLQTLQKTPTVRLKQAPAVLPRAPAPTVATFHEEEVGQSSNWKHVGVHGADAAFALESIQRRIHIPQKLWRRDHVIFQDNDPAETFQHFRDSGND